MQKYYICTNSRLSTNCKFYPMFTGSALQKSYLDNHQNEVIDIYKPVDRISSGIDKPHCKLYGKTVCQRKCIQKGFERKIITRVSFFSGKLQF